MPESMKVVAILAGSPALSSILNAVLAAAPGLRVRSFETQAALTAYMRLCPVDLVVGDFDCEAAPADRLASALRGNAALAQRNFQILALTSAVDEDMRAVAAKCGINEVIVKPMSPRYLLERVEARLRQPHRPRLSIVRAEVPREIVYRDNVVPLFPKGQPPRPTA
ncbi:MAG TPA: response regulator [Devosia sp.]|nr:response regulator [Devosia sp.]